MLSELINQKLPIPLPILYYFELTKKLPLPMGPSVSFPLPLRIAQKLPIRNSWELISESYQIPLPICYDFELIREVPSSQKQLQTKINKIPGFRIFSLLHYKSESERKSLGF